MKQEGFCSKCQRVVMWDGGWCLIKYEDEENGRMLECRGSVTPISSGWAERSRDRLDGYRRAEAAMNNQDGKRR